MGSSYKVSGKKNQHGSRDVCLLLAPSCDEWCIFTSNQQITVYELKLIHVYVIELI